MFFPPVPTRPHPQPWLLALLLLSCSLAAAQEAQIVVHAGQVSHRLSRYLTGACLEDVNHEVYGGLYSQMLYGESFQEPPPARPLQGFTAFGGRWLPREGTLWADAGAGPKLVADEPALADGEVGVEILFPDQKAGNAGLIVKVSEPGMGADRFTGYEIALDSAGQLVLGRHRQNWEPIRNVPCAVPLNQWLALAVRLTGNSLEILVAGRSVLSYEDRAHPLGPGRIGLRTWQREARFRNLWLKTAGQTQILTFVPKDDAAASDLSAMWRPVRRGSAEGEFQLETQRPFLGAQSQRVTFKAGAGEIGLENQGLNRWGLNFVKDAPYDGLVWLRPDAPASVFLALESADGSKVYAETQVTAHSNGWQRLQFTLTPNASDPAGRFALKLKHPASLCLGYAFLQPGEWGRFKGLPVRRDVSEALLAQGLTVLRYGGSMINHPAYRWKKMIGPRDLRPPSPGTWYAHSSNGWGIFDFLSFCEAAGFLGIPALNMDETPADLVDFVDYVNGPADSEWGRLGLRQSSGAFPTHTNGPADSEWGRRRAADGHPAPYRLKYLELGNEEAVDETYWRKFKPLAEAAWARDPGLILVVGDFAYDRPIPDPDHVEGAPLIKSLAAHKHILELAREHGREVWFDVHIGTEEPPAPHGLPGVRSFGDQLAALCPGARFKVAVFEFNAGNHALKRALANACAINQLERAGDRFAIACSANCLQPYRQNDNDWNQGLLFLSPAQVWPQPPYYVTQMVARNYLPLCLRADVQGPHAALDVTAKKSDDGQTITLQAVNPSNTPVSARLTLEGYVPRQPATRVTTLAGDWDAVNTPERPDRIKPTQLDWPHGLPAAPPHYTFPPRSFTLLRFD